MYQLLDFNVDYLASQQQPVFLVGTSVEAVKAYKRILIRSIQLGRQFCLAKVYSMDKKWIGKIFCSSIVCDLNKGVKLKGVYLVTEIDYKVAKRMIDILEEENINHIIVTLPVLQFPMKKEQFEQNRELFFKNRQKIQYIYNSIEEDKSKIIWEKLLRARWDCNVDRAELYKKAMELSIETNSKQYFPIGEIFDQSKEEGIFIDGGSLSGSAAIEFSKWCGNNYSKIYIFEPDVRYHDLIATNICCHDIERFVIIDAGLYDHTGVESFTAEPIGSSRVGSGTQKVPVISIDDLFATTKEPVTYIKMDIEGSECKALKGAKHIINNTHPKLAICIYHGETDIFEVPYQILKTFGYTKIFIRHYSYTVGESVIYAVR